MSGASSFNTDQILFGTDVVSTGVVTIGFDGTQLLIDALAGHTNNILIGQNSGGVLIKTPLTLFSNLTFSGGTGTITVPNILATTVKTDSLWANSGSNVTMHAPFVGVSGASVQFGSGIDIQASGLQFDAAAGNNIKFSNAAENGTTATFVNDASGNPIIDLVAIASSNSWLQFSRDVAQASVSVLSTVSNAALLLNSKGTGQITANAQINAPSFNATSSRSAKKAIKKFKKSAVDIINGIEIVSYQYKNQGTDAKEMVGFIAEDTDPLISGKDQKHFDINTTIGLLLKAVQELAHEVRTAHVLQS